MLCRSPIVMAAPFPCGQCIPCRINRRRLWTHRIMLESLMHGDTSFITLTYRPEDEPEDGSLVPAHHRDFMKIIRSTADRRWSLRLRMFAVGEYGDDSFRPHYHYMLYGYPRCERGLTDKVAHSRGRSCCEFCDVLLAKWGKGSIENAELNMSTAQYIAGYTVKKMTRVDDPRLGGRHPEFARQSNRPGIGADAVTKIQEAMWRPDGSYRFDSIDVPLSLRQGGRMMPLGRYLRSKLREGAGLDLLRPIAFAAYQTEVQALRDAYLLDPSFQDKTFSEALASISAGKAASIEARFKIFNQRSI